MGAPKKPTAVRKLHGTANRNKQRNNPNEPIVKRGIGPAPFHFEEDKALIWDEVVRIMYKGVLAETDRIALEVLVVLIWEFRTMPQQFTAAKLNQLNSFLSKFGMTPSDRTKISIPKGKKGSRFEGM